MRNVLAAAAGMLAVLLLGSGAPEPVYAIFSATPLVDFSPGQRYLGSFAGLLYTDPITHQDTNSVPAQHDHDGLVAASHVVPLNSAGNPAPDGKIGVVGIGMSNWNEELCQSNPFGRGGNCFRPSFLFQAASSPQVNHTSLVLADCGMNGQDARGWLNDAGGDYARCIQERLPLWGITPQQVEVVLWKDADGGPTVHLSPSTRCQFVPPPVPPQNPDACTYEEYVGIISRGLRSVFPNVRMLFVHSRIYAGYARDNLNPEPFAYEYGFATKWLVNAQIVQAATGAVDPVAGDLNYQNGTAPWIAWGPYWWAAGPMPCEFCQIPGENWVQEDYQADGTHPSLLGIAQVAQNLMSYYLSSPYSPWFRAP